MVSRVPEIDVWRAASATAPLSNVNPVAGTVAGVVVRRVRG